jgi:glycosyltransferase involved in cell wall biosynthesis
MINFSICLIARNEEKTLPRLLHTLEEFKQRGGEVVLLDTGSTDLTAKVARDWGCKVEEVGDKFVRVVSKDLADNINDKFCIDTGKSIVHAGDKNFDFASARNYCASLASNDMVSMPDCDEIFTKLDIDAVQHKIKQGYNQLEFNFVFAHGPNGEETIKFVQCKFYDRTVMHWEGIIHEVLVGNANRIFLPENIFKIEHYQNESTDRKGYLIGLAIDCYENPKKDRNSHYFARELMYRGFLHSAIEEFERHLTIGQWDAERSQSLIFIGDCYMMLGKDSKAIQSYLKAYIEFSNKREPLIKLGRYYFDKKDWARCVFFLEGCLRIQYSGFYADDLNHYGSLPYGMLYVACWWLGDKEKAKEYYDIAIKMEPGNPVYQAEAKFFYQNEYEDKGIEGWMTPEELEFLYQKSKEMKTVIEVGSWKGRSTDALLSGCKGTVTAVDHFQGSDDVNDSTKELGQKEDVYSQFIENVGHYKNLRIHKVSSDLAARALEGLKFDMVFIDAEHTYEGVKKDILMWKDKARVLLCGHDYQIGWPGVMKAVNEVVGKIDGVVGSIWYKYVTEQESKEINEVLTEKLKKREDFSFIKSGDGEEACMNYEQGANCDGSIYHKELGDKLNAAFEFFAESDKAHVVRFENQKEYNTLLHRTDNDLNKVYNFYDTIIRDNRKKIYVGRKELKIVAYILGAEFVEVPAIDGFSKYREITDKLLSMLKSDTIFIFSCGMIAKAMIHECMLKQQNATYIDIGSSFDPIIGQTRTYQITQDDILFMYKYFLPVVNILIPTLLRPSGLRRVLESIKKIKYPNLIVNTEEDEPRLGVAKRLNKIYKESEVADRYVYGSNDIEFTPNSIIHAVAESKENNLVAFNTGDVLPDEGNICEHFMIRRDYVELELDGKIFDEDFNHVGVDNLLWSKCKRKTRAELAIVHHYHFSKGGKMDAVYTLGWCKAEEDRELLKKKLAE